MNYKQFYDEEIAKQNKLIKEEDEILDLVSKRMDNIKEIAIDMGKELDKQNKDLIDVQYLTDNTHTHMKRTNSKLDKLLKHKNICLFITIVILVIILVALFVLLLVLG